MVAKYQIGFFPKGAVFPRKKDLVWGQAFDILGNCLLFAPKHGDPTHAKLSSSSFSKCIPSCWVFLFKRASSLHFRGDFGKELMLL